MRPETVDEHGTRHRHECPMPGWTSEPARGITGWAFVRCVGCGCVRLEREAREVTR